MKLRLSPQVILASCIVVMLFLVSVPIMAGHWEALAMTNCERSGMSHYSYPDNPPDDVERQETWPSPGWYLYWVKGLPIDDAGHAWAYISGTITFPLTWVPHFPNDIPNGNQL